MDRSETIAALIVAAGRGERAGRREDGPKQYRLLAGEPILRHTVRAFLDHPEIAKVIIAIHPDDEKLAEEAIAPLDRKRLSLIHGRQTRQLSVLAGLRSMAERPPDFVLIHDAARPLIGRETLDAVIDNLQPETGLIVGMPVTDTVKSVDASDVIVGTVDRETLIRAQTPQAFAYSAIMSAHENALAAGVENATDDAAIAAQAGMAVRVIRGRSANPKITFPEDISLAEPSFAPLPDVRVGNGYDVHCFEDGDAVILCGVAIPFHRRLAGHSDADVGLHALTDALLATIGAGDIGTHFPPSDPQWQGADSSVFIQQAVNLVRKKSGQIANVDVTLIAEEPKIGPHRETMTNRLAELVGIAKHRISVKATTNEKMGFIGRGEGIAAIATASVVFPGDVTK
ncbi:bifunctional 2-C-methyl-D-erythritol 4-phosphate cytidylyltransferase/2-C-methyl-D-erythritol 2,4-cyclodiphosphate synthase [Notoacmeibacter sp. MSK16QG-6]|uniref:bifunctional 2-C-methyl-D-erythritol 4-phosphate cytidylyltransferase/2-C-methyl-D-erythritol 2,4-cyclodiphosphate synthase n=1 Tax=Notoacmeibacter sp. MSK16QG-6 TaxID=2957982 RepID=UPI00209D59DF|nr:bifunctional 2-C-methyl-D-erythritol 4-phosphate cytidylyltransferase/2-C-methyl-D-erythritol 2,4-cyclodiphosphate synthase [Notoacmeibacter sp. MSK16QG-6]MCP1200761.1 bifunctional 2-C-methyl-D-erythritol 4-phosphate cytidylyltransferase/2-C-methyl-D-erythritol 2,4-cyclodiphosphate synthase [Notoacmeibacter sp. MSK16QG-6]